MRQFEVEVDGRKYIFRELTFGEVNDILRQVTRVKSGPLGETNTEIDWPTFTELLIQKAIVEPKELKDINKIRELPYKTAKQIVDYLLKELDLFR